MHIHLIFHYLLKRGITSRYATTVDFLTAALICAQYCVYASDHKYTSRLQNISSQSSTKTGIYLVKLSQLFSGLPYLELEHTITV